MNPKKYKPFQKIKLKNRTWPDNVITKSPIWCSSDLRDGNQALINPMNLEQKISFFKLLLEVGFKEIEIGFPAASSTELTFTRTLIEKNLVPSEVFIQVLTQCREHIIKETFESLKGAKKAIVHFYNSTSTLQREIVFKKSMDEVKKIAVDSAKLIKNLAKEYGDDRFWFEYSPESFTGTEISYAVDICNSVIEVINPTPERKLIINLPATVEMSTPNIYADQIEYMCQNLLDRKNLIISVHTHNDRGTAIAASELALLAGADRVEGTLLGNGERTGNADILTLAYNLYSQGIDPNLNISDVNKIIGIYEESTGMSIHPRHPYVGDLVYTAFSGSHQDAIKKGMEKMSHGYTYWEVPYLPIDPMDLNKSYDPIIRINSQSGKGGVSYILEQNYSIIPPKNMQKHFSAIITEVSDKSQIELQPDEIFDLFKKSYINLSEKLELKWYNEVSKNKDESIINCELLINGELKQFTSIGNGILDAFSNALKKELSISYDIKNYNEHSLSYGSSSKAITYMEIIDSNNNKYFGAGLSSNISKSSLRALVSCISFML